MKKFFGLVLIVLLGISCTQKIEKVDLTNINGYWEIQEVVLKDGSTKDYSINENYDYFEIGSDFSGFRKKVKPQLDGTFLVNNTQEQLKVRFANEKVFFDYTFAATKWSEELVLIDQDEMILVNSDEIKYKYKKATAIDLNLNGKKTK